jgi:uncharacterized protein YndB with AHSA1/START domain
VLIVLHLCDMRAERVMKPELFNVSPDCEIVSSRVIKSSCESVFLAWTDPGILQKWWGPKGFTNTFKEFDLRPGGKWRFTMHGPEKGNYENEVVFLQIEKPRLIAWQRLSQPIFRVVTTFEETEENYTTLTFRMQFDSKENADKLRKYVPEKNEENFDKLEAELFIAEK